MRVLTMNLWGRFGQWAERGAVLHAAFQALRPDLVACQEVIKTDDYDQLADLLGPDYHITHGTKREPDGSGCSIASRWPLLGVHELDLEVTPRAVGFPCMTLAAEVVVPDSIGPVLFVNHKPNFQSGLEYERELQAAAAARFVHDLVQRRAAHVVLVGDQDAVPEATSIRFWCGRQSVDGLSVCYRDAWETVHPGEPGYTFSPSRNPLVNTRNWPGDLDRRIDYIFVGCRDHGPTLRVVACGRVLDEPVAGVWASDHFGVRADLAAVEPNAEPVT
jgi:endonuclease/exonuclease/phosphatase family metal-dependent hydrolase